MQSDEVTTPESRPHYDTGTSEKTRRHVREAAPSNGRCLVTNFQSTTGVEYCHCVPKRYMQDDEIVCVYSIMYYIILNTPSLISSNGPGT